MKTGSRTLTLKKKGDRYGLHFVPVPFFRSISFILSLFLILNQSLYGNVLVQDPKNNIFLNLDSSSLGLNHLSSFATVSDIFIPFRKKVDMAKLIRDPNQKLVIYLEDAHCVISAQKNIAQSIDFISKKMGIKEPWIGLEGTSNGEIDHRILSAFPYKSTRNRIAEYFLRQGMLNGADYYAAIFNPKARLFGVDHEDLARENRQSYKDFFANKSDIAAALAKLDKANTLLKDRIYYGDLVELKLIAENWERNSNHDLRYLDRLQELALKHKVPLRRYPAFYNLLQTRQLESKLTPFELERNLKQLDGSEIFHDIDQLFKLLWKKLAYYQEAREAHQIDKIVKFYLKLFDFSLTSEAYQDYLKNPEKYSLDFLNQLFKKYYFLLRPKTLRPTEREIVYLKRTSQYPLHFYQVAEKRNEFLVKNLNELIQHNPTSKTFLIAGGFHRENLLSEFKKQEIPYIVFSPKMTATDGTENYWKLLGGGWSEIKHFSQALASVALRDYLKNRQFRQALAGFLVGDFYADRRPDERFSNRLLNRYQSRLGERDRPLIENARSKIKSEHENSFSIIDPSKGDPRYVVQMGEGRVRGVTSTDFHLLSSTRVNDYTLTLSERSEIRNFQIDYKILQDTKQQPETRRSNWILRLSNEIAQNVNSYKNTPEGRSWRTFDARKLREFLSEIQWASGDANTQVSKMSRPLEHYKTKVHFTNDLKRPTSLNDEKTMLSFDVKAIAVFLEDNQPRLYLAELFAAVALRNYLVGHLFNENEEMVPDKRNPREKDASLKFNRNAEFVANILQKQGDGQAVQAFLAGLAQMSNRFSSSVEFRSAESAKFIEVLLKSPLLTRLAKAQGPVEFSETSPSALPEEEGNFPANPSDGSRFIILAKIGEGGFGITGVAIDKKKNRLVVIKVNKKKDDHQVGVAREWRFLKRLTELGSEHYPKYYGRHGLRSNHQPEGYLVMSFANGFKLSELIGQWDWEKNVLNNEKLSLSQTIEITKKILQGIGELHRFKILHRDVKPENIVVSITDDRGRELHPELTEDEVKTLIRLMGKVPFKDAEKIFTAARKIHTQEQFSELMKGLNKFHLEPEEVKTLVRLARKVFPDEHLKKEMFGKIDPASLVKKVTILDLGLAKSLREVNEESMDSTDESTTGDPNKLKGTLGYIAPEKSFQTPVTEAYDVFAIAATLYRMLTGRLPGKSNKNTPPHEILMSQLEGTIELPFKEPRTEQEKWLNQITLRGLNQAYPEMSSDYAQRIASITRGPARYATTDEFLDTLKSSFSGAALAGRTNGINAAKQEGQILSNPWAFVRQKLGLDPSAQRAPPGSSRRSFKKLLIGSLLAGFFAVILFGLFAILPSHPTDTNKQTQTTHPSETISYEGSMQFNGQGDAVVINSLLGKPQSVTLAAWVDLKKVNEFGSELIIIGESYSLAAFDSNRGGLHGRWLIMVNNDFGHFPITSKKNIEGTGFRFVSFVYDSKNFSQKLYIDGSEVAQSNSREKLEFHPEVNITTIGNHPSELNPGLNGKLSHVHIYAEPLSAEEIMAIMNKPNSIQKRPLLYLPLNKTHKTRDLSGNNNHGTIRGSPIYSDATPALLLKFKETRETLKPRSEMRKESRFSFENRLFRTDFYKSILFGKEKALLILPYEDLLIQSLFKKMLPLPNTYIVFLANKDTAKKILEDHGPLEKLYGFRIIESTAFVSELNPNNPELRRILMRAAASFGVPIQDLGRPVLFSEDFTALDANPQDWKEAKVIYLRLNKKRFVRELPYQGAHLVVGVALSKNAYDIFKHGALQFQDNEITLTESTIRQFKEDIKTIFTVARSA